MCLLIKKQKQNNRQTKRGEEGNIMEKNYLVYNYSTKSAIQHENDEMLVT